MNSTFLTFPQPEERRVQSKDIIADAICNADEISWASAYLTSWPLSKKCVPKKTCSLCNIVIGSDFGITRKSALFDLLKWSKRSKANVYINETSGFHPKVLIWREGSKRFALIGSSNLSAAAWSSNIELNIRVALDKEHYEFLTDWFQDMVIGASPHLDKPWIKTYKESKRKHNAGHNAIAEIDYRIKQLGKVELTGPRRQLRIYNKNKLQFIRAIKACASGGISNKTFYEEMLELLRGTWRGNSHLISMNCKKENWKEICSYLNSIISAKKSDRDRIVKQTIDSLKSTNNLTRGAWLSEILCHHYPFDYPLINDPVKTWIRKNKIAKLYGIPTGYEFISISRIMRHLLTASKSKFRNFIEMDHAIWVKTVKE
jgi:hypothetical protein